MKAALILLLAIVSTAASAVDDETLSTQQQIGFMVQSLADAIDSPSPKSVEIIAHYGTNSRYYVMIRGWLVQELTGIESQLAAQGDNADPVLVNKAKHLKISLRRIDLE
ncbi:hypothetical protein [Shewanella psychrotolerans]|uniref:hypothetical protein n=1 Tax=Shewanella psychrotolerans TaxID=2864206 RepID=UPI001C655612|nr:hypothetical protein [Shewanella psychrotolerans]QYK01859.1 hypothetical protein K0I62_02435 [Shewanella psychrotolerans]